MIIKFSVLVVILIIHIVALVKLEEPRRQPNEQCGKLVALLWKDTESRALRYARNALHPKPKTVGTANTCKRVFLNHLRCVRLGSQTCTFCLLHYGKSAAEVRRN